MSGKLLPIFAGLRHRQVLSKCGFLKALLDLLQISLSKTVQIMLTDFETPESNNNMQISASHNNSTLGSVLITEATARGGGVLSYMGYIGVCGPKGYGFSAVLVIIRVSILAILPPFWS